MKKTYDYTLHDVQWNSIDDDFPTDPNFYFMNNMNPSKWTNLQEREYKIKEPYRNIHIHIH